MREERIGNVTIHLGDCREVMAGLEGKFSIVTDPPFGLGDKWQGGGGSKRSGWAFNPAEAKRWDRVAPTFVSELPAMADECIIWGGNYFVLPPSRGWLVWDKKQNDAWTTGQCELAWTSIDRPIRAFRFAQCEQANEGPKLHPTQKPLALMQWCLKWVTGSVVVDPYCGSGTTGVACVNLGRKFIGIEIDEGYFDIACRRVEAAYAQPRLFEEPAPSPSQQVLV